MEGPCVLGKELAFLLAPGVCVPELSGEDESTKSLDTARVHLGRVLRRARKQRLLEEAGVIQRTLAWVELCESRSREQE